MKKLLCIIQVNFLVGMSFAQPAFNKDSAVQKEFSLHPLYSIELRTMEGNVLNGLFLQADDSSLIVYPGKWIEWNKNKQYRPVIFNYTQVKEILLKRTDKVLERTIPSVATAADQKGNLKIPEPVEFRKTMVTINNDPGEISYTINGELLLFTAFKNQAQ